jgi:hypothetical protein
MRQRGDGGWLVDCGVVRTCSWAQGMGTGAVGPEEATHSVDDASPAFGATLGAVLSLVDRGVDAVGLCAGVVLGAMGYLADT